MHLQGPCPLHEPSLGSATFPDSREYCHHHQQDQNWTVLIIGLTSSFDPRETEAQRGTEACKATEQVNVRAGARTRLMTPAQSCQTHTTRLFVRFKF